MCSFSNTLDAWTRYFNWDDHEVTIYSDLFQSVTIAGALVGALSCSSLLFMAKLRLLRLLNLTLVIGVAITLIGKYVWLLCFGRFVWGLALGAFTVVCAKMVDEITPIELSGPLGAINQL